MTRPANPKKAVHAHSKPAGVAALQRQRAASTYAACALPLGPRGLGLQPPMIRAIGLAFSSGDGQVIDFLAKVVAKLSVPIQSESGWQCDDAPEAPASAALPPAPAPAPAPARPTLDEIFGQPHQEEDGPF
jgi:hypothetical protein